MIGTNERWYFHWADWLVFASMLGLSAGAGLWHFRRAKKSSTLEYLLGSRNIGLYPIAASLIASFVSGVTILGTPAEVYNFGTQYWVTVISLMFSGIVVANVYLPVFTTLKLNSVYEYLELRFSRSVRILISLIFVVDVVLYQSIVVYVPSLALNQVSGINIHLIGGVVCFVCMFYTVLGGLRAVVWADVFQVVIMITAVATVTVLGTYEIGGVAEVWRRSDQMNRIHFLNTDPSPYTRHTLWTVLVGSFLYSTSYIAVNQTMVQRYTSLPTEKLSKVVLGIFTIGVMTFVSLCCWCGLVLLSWWAPPKCDPRATGLIDTDDQLLPAYVMEIAGSYHGIPGLFTAGIFGAALSTLSVGLNSTSVVLLEDFVKGCFQLKPSERTANVFVKSVIIALGLSAFGFIFLVEKLGGVLAVTGSLASIAAGTSFGVFTLGMLFPWTNSKGAFVGAVAGFVVAGWASLGANIAVGTGHLVPKKLPVPLDHCPANLTEIFLQQFVVSPSEDEVFPLYRISYHLIAGLGTLVVILVGGLVTLATGPRNPLALDRNLLSPVIHRWLPQAKYNIEMDRWQQRLSLDGQASSQLLTKEVAAKRRNTIPLTDNPDCGDAKNRSPS